MGARELFEGVVAGLRQPSTQRCYRLGLRLLAEFLGCDEDAALQRLLTNGREQASAIIKSFAQWRVDNGTKHSTAYTNATPLMSLVAAARNAGVVDWDLNGCLPWQWQKPLAARTVQSEHAYRIILTISEAANERRGARARDEAIVHLLLSASSEAVASLHWPEDVDLSLGIVRFAGDERIVGTEASAALAKWIAVRGSRNGWLFTRTDRCDDRRPLKTESIRRMLRKWGRRAKLGVAVRAEDLRALGKLKEKTREVRDIADLWTASLRRVVDLPSPPAADAALVLRAIQKLRSMLDRRDEATG